MTQRHDEDERPVETAPEGATCAEHPERQALVTCPRCGDYCCVSCWHGSVRRCHECLLRDPGPPVPWAERRRSLPDRFFATLGQAFRPRASAPSLSRGDWRRGISFGVWTFVPLAMLCGIIPFTHTLGFGPSWSVTPLGQPSGGEVALDVLRAAAMGLAMSLAKLGILAAAYVSLATAYGKGVESKPERQVILYRAWLLPLGGAAGLLLGIVIWGLPLESTPAMGLMAQIVSLLPLVLLLSSMLSAARVAAGIGPIASLAVVLVPFMAMFVVEPLLLSAMSPWLPDSEAMREAVESAGR